MDILVVIIMVAVSFTLGAAIMNRALSRNHKFGTLIIDRSKDDKDVFLMDIENLEAAEKLDWVILDIKKKS